MDLYLIESDLWTVYALDSVLMFLESIESQYSGMVAQLMPLLERVASDARGPRSLNKKICHRVDEQGDIWQIRKGRIRVLWFYDEGRVIICAHAFLKKDNKTPKREKEQARSAKAAYLDARQAGRIRVIDGTEDG